MHRLLVGLTLLACVACRATTPAPPAAEDERGLLSGATPTPTVTAPTNPEHPDVAPTRVSTSPSKSERRQKGDGSKEKSIPLTVTVNRTCIEPGQEMRVTAKTLPGAQMGFTAYYASDNNFAPDAFFVPSEGNQTGTVVWAFIIRPATPPGDAQLDVLAMKTPDGAAHHNQPFRVERSC